MPSFEDFVFGFAITGIAANIYDVIFNKKNIKAARSRKKLFLTFFLTGLIMLLIFNNWLGINSIFISSFAFLAFSAMIVAMRKDLLVPAVASGTLTAIIAFLIYAVFFSWLVPDYWEKYWLLKGTRFGITVLGEIPLTEILWYFSWGCLGGVSYEFSLGVRKANQALPSEEVAKIDVSA